MVDRSYGLATDLYEMTMAAAYFERGIVERATFELFVRKLPPHRSYLISAGLDQALDYLSSLRFTGDEIDYLRRHPSFKKVSSEFFDYLSGFRFTGDVWAMPEGTAAFAMEPLLRVSGPVIEAQIVETFLLATINFQTMIASKAARIVTTAGSRSVIEFGTRRAHGTEAGLLAARAAFIAGCAGTSNVEAGHTFGIPTFGTLAHSFIMLFDDEDEAFRAFLKVFPDTATVLLDTYDTIAAVTRLAQNSGAVIPAVRLDSGDLLSLSLRVRDILDQAGMNATKILASGDLNEYRIARLIEQGARIDAFGVGTELATSYDSPALSGVYKLVGREQGGRFSMSMKISPDKATYPGLKQVWRMSDSSGKYAADTVALADEGEPRSSAQEGASAWRPLLEPVMKDGCRVDGPASSRGSELGMIESPTSIKAERLLRLHQSRARAADEIKRLPVELLALDSNAQYPVKMSERLVKEKETLEAGLKPAGPPA